MPRWLILLAFGCSAFVARADAPALAPPADPAPPKPAVVEKKETPAVAQTKDLPAVGDNLKRTTPAHAPGESLPYHHDESDVPDSIGAITVRPVIDADEPEPAYLKHVDFLRQQTDHAMASSYLEKIVANPDLAPRERARAILVLSDELRVQKRDGDELCWLKIWVQLYPERQEAGAVAYRMGTLYTRMGLTELARDSFYLALSNAVNHGQVQDDADLKRYTKLTCGTLWALAQNEYQAGNWKRASDLFDRFRKEAQSPPPGELVRAQYLQADCYYQLHDQEKASAAYTEALAKHPFYALAPEARLRLYHLDMMAKKPQDAQGELQALIWSVRTVWPTQEAYWQERTAQLLLALNHNSGDALPPLVKKCASLAGQDKAWQADLGHYDKLASLVATMPQNSISDLSSTPAGVTPGGLSEQEDLRAMSRSIGALAPPKISAGTTPPTAAP